MQGRVARCPVESPSSLSDLKLRQAAKCKTARRLPTERSERTCFGHHQGMSEAEFRYFQIQLCPLPAGGFA